MKTAILYSGGKDSTLATLRIMNAGHEIAALVSVIAKKTDSWMFHIPNVELTKIQAECMGLPWRRLEVVGEKEKEVDDLQSYISQLKDELGLEAIGTGAIASKYQRERVSKMCKALGLGELSPLWGGPEESLLQELLDRKFEVYFAAVAAEGLGKDWLGSRLDEHRTDQLLKLKARLGINASGEGGEYETFVADCPLFKKRIVIEEGVTEWHHNTGTWTITKYRLQEKPAL